MPDDTELTDFGGSQAARRTLVRRLRTMASVCDRATKFGNYFYGHRGHVALFREAADALSALPEEREKLVERLYDTMLWGIGGNRARKADDMKAAIREGLASALIPSPDGLRELEAKTRERLPRYASEVSDFDEGALHAFEVVLADIAALRASPNGKREEGRPATYEELQAGYEHMHDMCRQAQDGWNAERRKLWDAEARLLALSAPVASLPDETDEEAKLVERFAGALLKKLRASEAKYGWQRAWMKSDWEGELSPLLLKHVGKGDPIDVAAYAAFAWHHGWSLTLPASLPDEEAVERSVGRGIGPTVSEAEGRARLEAFADRCKADEEAVERAKQAVEVARGIMLRAGALTNEAAIVELQEAVQALASIPSLDGLREADWERVVDFAIQVVPETVSIPDDDGSGTTRLFVRIDHMGEAIRAALRASPNGKREDGR